MSLVLRSYWRSSCSWRVRIALNLKGLDYDTEAVHLVEGGGQQHSDTHRALNPMRELPVLSIDGQPLAQSVAILEYLEECHPEPALLPSEPLARARVRQMVEVVNSGTQPVQNLRVMQELGRRFDVQKPGQLGWSRHWITFGFDALEALVAEHAGRFCFGDSVTLADVCLVPQMYNARRFDVDLSAHPHLVRIDETLASLPGFVEAHPDRQPDAP